MSRDICLRCPDTQQNADERTRTSTWLPRHGPEPCASTNSATSACRRASEDSAPLTDEPGGYASLFSGVRKAGLSSRTRCERFAILDPIDFAPLSSRGLGRRPLMAETRVRIPVAVLTTKALQLRGFCYVRDDAHGRSALRVTHSERTSGLRAPAISSSGSMRSRPEYSSIRCAYVESSTASECPACLATSTGWRPSARRREVKLWRRS